VWLAVGPDPRFTHALVSAIAVLVRVPVRDGLATPTAIMAGTGRGADWASSSARAKHSSGRRRRAVVFDKTARSPSAALVSSDRDAPGADAPDEATVLGARRFGGAVMSTRSRPRSSTMR
jgi:hypothetical protein